MKRRGFLQLLASTPLAAVLPRPRARRRVVVRTGLPPCRFRKFHEGVSPSRWFERNEILDDLPWIEEGS